MIKKIVIFLFAVLLFACGPRYHTDYQYGPLKTEGQQTCGQVCNSSQQTCRMMKENQYQSCQHMAEVNYNLCKSLQVWIYDYQAKERRCISNCYCYRNYCAQPDYQECLENYHQCYVGCGGEIKAYTRCVGNCEKAVPDQTILLNKKGRTVLDAASDPVK